MGKTKAAATGRGYLGEIMVHMITGEVGVVDNVVEAKAGWPPQITLKLPTGSFRKGKLGDFRDATAAQKKKYATSPAASTPATPAAAD